MAAIPLYPLLLQPSLHVKVWGGRRLNDILHIPLPTDEPYGEAWELHDTATVVNGPLAGRTVGDLLREYGTELVGPGNNPADGFPVLIKFLDARDWLSVQVHPNDEQAQRLDNELRGKTEAWYVIAADPGAKLIIGITPGMGKEQLAQLIEAGQMKDVLVYAEVKAGDVLFISPGTVHALGPGIVIYEVQQSSDLTYRFYDWDRMGLDGTPRALHIDKSIEVSNLDHLPEILHTGDNPADKIPLISSPYFKTELLQFMNGGVFSFAEFARSHFDALTCIEGRAVVESDGNQLVVETGQTVLVPAAVQQYEVLGRARVLRSTQANS